MKKYILKDWSLFILNDHFNYQDKGGCYTDCLYRKVFGLSRYKNLGVTYQI